MNRHHYDLKERWRSWYATFPNKDASGTLISGDNFRLPHPIVWLVRHVCSDKAEFSFCQRRPLFDAMSDCPPLLLKLKLTSTMEKLLCSVYRHFVPSLWSYGCSFIIFDQMFQFLSPPQPSNRSCSNQFLQSIQTLRDMEIITCSLLAGDPNRVFYKVSSKTYYPWRKRNMDWGIPRSAIFNKGIT